VAARKSLGKRLGRSVAKKPETLTLDDALEDVPETPPVVEAPKSTTEPYTDSQGMVVDPAAEAAHRSKWQQENAWQTLRGNLGLVGDAQVRMLTDFIRDKGLFAELTTYAKRRSRR
jgi:hypothetical protein